MFQTNKKTRRYVHTCLMDFSLKILVHFLQRVGTQRLPSVLLRLGLRPVQRQPWHGKGTDQL